MLSTDVFVVENVVKPAVVNGGEQKSVKEEQDAFIEPILRENPDRLALFPIEHPALFRHYKNHVALFWTVEEIDFSRDLKDWEKLTQNEKHFIKTTLGFFSSSDTLIMSNIAARFMNEIKLEEAKQFYAVQMMMEAIHSETYSLLIDTYIEDKAEKLHLFQAARTIPCVKEKADWAKKWIADEVSDFATRLIAFAIIEGLFFSSSFASLAYIRERNLMPGLTFSNSLIMRDEGLHTDFAAELYTLITHRVPKVKFNKIMKEAVEIETRFTIESLPSALIGINSTLMTQHVKFVADRLCSQLGYPKIYNVGPAFDFLERVSMPSKVNFFEARNDSYAKSGVGKTRDEMSFALDADF